MERRSFKHVALALGLVTLLALAACGGGKAASKKPAGITNKTSVEMTEFSYKQTGSITAGMASLTFRNAGTLDHMALFALLKPGATVQQAFDAISKNQDPSAFFADAPDRSPVVLTPGEKTEMITDLFKPGTYAMLCFIPAADGMPHAAKGMLGEVKVSEGTPAPANIASDGDILVGNGTMTLPSKMSTGKGTFKVVPEGSGGHSVQIVRLNAGKTYEDLDKYFSEKYEENKAVGEAPGQVAAISTTVLPGETLYLVLDLAAGNYAAACGEGEGPDEHDAKGEKATFTVA